MKAKSSSFFVIFWICCAPLILSAQHEESVSRIYSMKDGLPDEGVTCIIQDSRGFIWLGTYSGLCRFDGYRFTTYRNNPTSGNSLRNNHVSSIWEDKVGRLWIGHTQGLDVFDPRTEDFIFHWPDSGKILNGLHPSVLRLLERKDKKLWICATDGVYVVDPEIFNIVKYEQIPSMWWTFDIAETKNGSIATASTGGSGFYVDAKTSKAYQFIGYPSHPTGLPSFGKSPSFFGRCIMVDKMDRIWIGTNSELYLFDQDRKIFTRYHMGFSVFEIFERSDGKFFIGRNDGLFLFDPKDGKIDTVNHATSVFSVAIDNQGNVWNSSLNGLRQLQLKQKKFNVYRQFGNRTGSIAEDAGHDMWLLSDSHGNYRHTLYRLNSNFEEADGKHKKNLNPPEYFRAMRSLFVDRERNVWHASAKRLEVFDVKKHVFHSIENAQSTIDPISSFIDSHDTVWFGGWDGVARLDTKGKVNKRLKSFPEVNVHSFLEDKNQNVWIGSDAGLGRYNLTTGNLDIFYNDPNIPQTLSNNTVYHVMMDRDDNIWIGTGGGLNRMIKGTENTVPKFLSWSTAKSGLPNDDVYCIVDGGDGTLWMSCGNMISHFFPSENTFRNYDHHDGLPGNNFRGLAYLRGKGLRRYNGDILFGSTNGLVSFHPDSLVDNTYVPPIVITEFSIQNRVVPLRGSEADTLTWESPLTSSISFTEKIELLSHQNDFTLEFSALNYVNSERNQYKYRLEPYQNEWISTTADNRTAQYTNLDPGTYTFRVIGSNNDGVWNQQGATLVIVIFPPWWQTWWAYSLYGLTLTAMFLYWRHYDIKRVKLKHRAEHLSELDALKTRFFTNISHEFRTPITLIQGPLREMYNKASNDEERSEIGVMQRNARRLSRLINQLLDLSKLEAGKMTLHAAPLELVQFLREIVASYESLAIDKKIKFLFYAEVPELLIYIDYEKMEKVVHNLLSNAFKFTNEGGEVILNLKASEKHGVIIVKDTGIGIPADQLDKVFDRFYQVDTSQTRAYEGSGLGMALAKELVELHHGTVSVESAEDKGSTFFVRLPLGKEHLRKEERIDSGGLKKSCSVSEELISEHTSIEISLENETISSDSQPVLLIVEDNADMRHYIRKTLSDQYQIIEANDGKTGVTLAKESVPDLIISDIMMPEMDGYNLCQIIKTNELTSHIPVILLTAKADRESKLAGLEIGADDYLSKPFDADELKLIVRNRIEERRKMRERFSREITLEPKQISITSLDEKFLTKVLAIIEEHMDDEMFSIDELSREGGYSNMQFYRKIKALSGQTPSQFLRTIRLKRAAELLAKNSDNVTQIAYSVGFSSLSYFNKCFKEQFGVTPGQFAAGSRVPTS